MLKKINPLEISESLNVPLNIKKESSNIVKVLRYVKIAISHNINPFKHYFLKSPRKSDSKISLYAYSLLNKYLFLHHNEQKDSV